MHSNRDAARRGGKRAPEKGGGLPRATALEQGDIFGAVPGAGDVGPATRSGDPATSRAAARRAARGLTDKQLAVLEAYQMSPTALTHETLVELYRARRHQLAVAAWYPTLTDSSVRTRSRELVTLGYVELVDDYGRTAAGGRAQRWRVSARGVAVNIETERFTRTPGKLRP